MLFQKQFQKDSCVSACVKYILQIYDLDLNISEKEIYERLGSASSVKIIQFLETYKLKCKLIYKSRSALLKWLKYGEKGLALLDIRTNGWHCNLVENQPSDIEKITIWEPLDDKPKQYISFECLWKKIYKKNRVAMIIVTK